MLEHRSSEDGEHISAPPPSAAADLAAGSRGGRLRRLARRVLREPLAHFVLIGTLLYVVTGQFEERVRRYAIDVSPTQLSRLIQTYGAQYGGQPSPEQTKALVDGYIKEEIYLREGIALGLDKDDEIVRRRVAQKFEFIQQDRAAPPAPTPAELKTYYADHLEAYRHPTKRSFDQIYFAMDQRGEDGARRAAEAMLARLASGATPEQGAGDPFPGPSSIRSLTQEEVARLFGGGPFAAELFRAPFGRWSGPYRSGYGWHLVHVTEIAPPRQRGFSEAQEDVAADRQQAERAARNDASFRRLLSRYRVSVAGVPR